MPVDPVSSGVGSVSKASDTATGTATGATNAASSTAKTTTKKPIKKVQKTAKPVTSDPDIPGRFPKENEPRKPDPPPPNFSAGGIWASIKAWFASFVPWAFDWFEIFVQGLINKYFPAPKQAAMYEKMLQRPIASTFLICQMICLGVPLLVFLLGVFLFAIIAVLLWIVLALLILGPVLLVASMMGVSLWGWGWVFYGLIKFLDRKFLGGVIMRTWALNATTEDGEEEREKEEAVGGDGDEKKEQ
ncbi:Uncharacterized protein PECH_001000 [Penicillium ucsense]|uniref:Uncharacterized protein n=1 Tax=Penicillium ucsense TaxID=2839758 RepID=A0A8J8VYH7_9EURO|nr:Uncharacterized protein PECM_008722 [Penicillium ucsense]KAF7733174.1 Uncharacterized protein PECH_001000 [Penicillium ucsense]